MTDQGESYEFESSKSRMQFSPVNIFKIEIVIPNEMLINRYIIVENMSSAFP